MRFQTLDEWLTWQETLHATAIDLKLERVASVQARLGRPAYAVLTVAGTNGKGSCVAMLESILLAAGYRVGSYTSPHLLRYNERIRINGQEAGDALICASFARIDQARGATTLTYFEFATLAAIDIFRAQQVDIAILEVGLGGRLDAVNILDADVALITTIDLDHQKWLGNDRESIGREKAGILRAGRPAVCIDAQPPASLLRHAAALPASLYVLGRDFHVQTTAEGWVWSGPPPATLSLPRPALAGEFQLHNAAGVIMALALLAPRVQVTAEAIASGLRAVRLRGRFEQLRTAPEVIVDVAHNPQGMRSLAANLRARSCTGQTRVVLSMLADKDIESAVAELRPQVDAWYLGSLPTPRAAPLVQLTAAVTAPGSAAKPAITTHDSIEAAYAAACREAGPGDRIVVTGSFYTVAAILAQTV